MSTGSPATPGSPAAATASIRGPFQRCRTPPDTMATGRMAASVSPLGAGLGSVRRMASTCRGPSGTALSSTASSRAPATAAASTPATSPAATAVANLPLPNRVITPAPSTAGVITAGRPLAPAHTEPATSAAETPTPCGRAMRVRAPVPNRAVPPACPPRYRRHREDPRPRQMGHWYRDGRRCGQRAPVRRPEDPASDRRRPC